MEANGQIVGCRLKPRKSNDDTVTDDDDHRRIGKLQNLPEISWFA